MEGGGVFDDSRMENVLLKNERVSCASEVLDSLWAPNSSPSYHGSILIFFYRFSILLAQLLFRSSFMVCGYLFILFISIKLRSSVAFSYDFLFLFCFYAMPLSCLIKCFTGKSSFRIYIKTVHTVQN